MNKVISLCKRRGFIFSGSEIYGGLSGTYDYGPLGVELKNNIKKLWWQSIVWGREDIFGLDADILMNAKTWEASGHTKFMTDPMLECKKCHHRFKGVNSLIKSGKCQDCGGILTEPKNFNLMFETKIGPTDASADKIYLRPETAQGIFVNFKNILNSMHPKLPFGIAQIGKAFRNEITPSNFTFRTREFEQMELEYFVLPGESDKYFEYWRTERLNWYLNLGLKKENLRLRNYQKDELAHYSKATTDIEYKFPFEKGFDEIEGIANRGDFDLKQHLQFSNSDLNYFNEESKEKIIPYVIEPSAGLDRITLAVLLDAYYEEKDKDGIRTVLRIKPNLAPYKVAVFPLLSNKEELIKKAKEVYRMFHDSSFMFQGIAWDDIGNIGKRYRRQDEIGTPWCVTIDFETLENDTVTVRDRDTMKQERIKINELNNYFINNL